LSTSDPIDFTNEGFRKAFLSSMERGEPGFPVLPRKLPSIFVNEKDRAYVDSELTPQPVGTYAQAITLSGAREKIAKPSLRRFTPSPTMKSTLLSPWSFLIWAYLSCGSTSAK
jgi:hypothetical protein